MANPLPEIDLASATAQTLDGGVKPVPGGGWNAQRIDSNKDTVIDDETWINERTPLRN